VPCFPEKVFALAIAISGYPSRRCADIIAFIVYQRNELVAAVRSDKENPLTIVFIFIDLRRRIPFGLRFYLTDLLLHTRGYEFFATRLQQGNAEY
jgi:hypothetical protein